MNREFLVERNGRNFVLYAGLLDLAHERGLKAITTALVQIPSDLNGNVAICHATVETAQGTFTGLGDADPENVSRMMLPHLIRMAETRAKARALRDAVNVSVTALEELADLDDLEGGEAAGPRPAPATSRNGSSGNSGTGTERSALRALAPIAPSGLEGPEGPEEHPAEEGPHREAATRSSGASQSVAPRQASMVAPGAGLNVASSTLRPGAAPATAKQLQTIERMSRAAGKSIPAEGLTRAQASEIISTLIGEMDQQRAS